jgi:peptidase M42 family hydrolase
MTGSQPTDLPIDTEYLKGILHELLEIPSPSGMTDAAVRRTCRRLDELRIPFELSRRGAIRANFRGRSDRFHRGIVAHLDTLGAMVKRLKENGRLAVVPIGTWSARFAEGARVTLFSDRQTQYRGTLLPLKASGHAYNEEVDSQPGTWNNLELRVDARVHSKQDLEQLGIQVGDHIAIDPQPEFAPNGFITARHLDDKAGVAAVLAAAKAVQDAQIELPVNCHLLFTISEEIGVGASHILHGDVAELVSVDNGTIAPEQNTSEYGVTLAMQDSSGPFDWHLSRRLIALCEQHHVSYSRDVFNYYRSDAAAALAAGNDIRTALVCFAVDASHGWERTHRDSLTEVARLLALYMQSDPIVERDWKALGPLADFPAEAEHVSVPFFPLPLPIVPKGEAGE